MTVIDREELRDALETVRTEWPSATSVEEEIVS